MINYKSRFYDTELGRFIQADIVIPDKENPKAQDRYAYAANNPVNYSDPTGNCFFTGIDTAICILIEMLATGALAGYGIEVAENMAEGTYGVDALTDVDTTQVVNTAIFTPAIFIAPYIINTSVGLYYQDLGVSSNNPSLINEGNMFLNGANNYLERMLLGIPPVPEKHIASFLESEYTLKKYGPNDTLYRVHSPGNEAGNWWTNKEPLSEIQFRIDQAVPPEWNTAENISVLTIPKGRELWGYWGKAEYQGNFYIGGGDQIFLPKVPGNWIDTLPFER